LNDNVGEENTWNKFSFWRNVKGVVLFTGLLINKKAIITAIIIINMTMNIFFSILNWT